MNTSAAEQLRLSDFDYVLPEALIAQEPCPQRDRSRLMVVQRSTGVIEHRIFSDIEHLLVPGDLLVLNNTKVFPCRLLARKPGGGKAEVFLLSERGPNLWDALVKGGVPTGRKLIVAQGIEAEVTGDLGEGVRTIRFHGVSDIKSMLPELGRTPLPPYIRRDASASDRERYQTVYASEEGAVAAPTAGLHFTRDLMQTLVARGVEFTSVTLHVGPGTFQPVKSPDITEHRMHPERYAVTDESALRINRARNEGRRVIAVGTTSMRALESVANDDGAIVPGEGSSTLFIYPGYCFKIANGLITNFHLPKSTLLMLVSAFAGRENILAAYQCAVAEQYRFYSYGDAMAIL